MPTLLKPWGYRSKMLTPAPEARARTPSRGLVFPRNVYARRLQSVCNPPSHDPHMHRIPLQDQMPEEGLEPPTRGL